MSEHEKEALGREVCRLFERLYMLNAIKSYQKQDFMEVADTLRKILQMLDYGVK